MMPSLFKTLLVPGSLFVIHCSLSFATLNVTASAGFPSSTTLVIAESLTNFVSHGTQISLNGIQTSASWVQWRNPQTGIIHTGLSDIPFSQNFGIELLSSPTLSEQPVRWFSDITLSTKHSGAYRYLDITDLATLYGWRLQANGDTLTITTPAVRVQTLDTQMQTTGEPQATVTLPRQINITLTGPTPTQVNFVRRLLPPTNTSPQTPPTPADSPDDASKPATQPQPQQPPTPRLDEWLINLNAQTDPAILEKINFPKNQPTPLKIETTPNGIAITILVPAGWRPKLSTLANPYRLTIDIQPEYMVEKNVLWSKDIRWQQKYLSLGSDRFPVVWLEIDPTNAKPITTNRQTQIGTAPLTETANSTGVQAAINGGFFNRNNKMPLGAIRQDGVWLSSPILGRGAIAWNNQGRVIMNRLKLQQTAITNTGQKVPVDYLNSAYVQTGISRYTPEWGPDYTPLSDNETIIVVENDTVIGQISPGGAGKLATPIPKNGYLLIYRKVAVSEMPKGTQIKLENQTIPENFKEYPNVLGAGPLLLQNRQIVLDAKAEGFSDAFIKQTASRSVIATTKDGKLIIAAIHNRAGGAGATLAELAQLMQQLGAVDALNLDGGSSTGLYLGGSLIDRPLPTAAPVHNGLGIYAPMLP